MSILKYKDFLLESNKEYLEDYCSNSIYEIPLTPVPFNTIFDHLEKLNDKIGYKKTIESIKKGDAAIVAIRSSLDLRAKFPEQYLDKIFFIPKEAIKKNPSLTPYQATTVPSVGFYKTEVAILDDGEYKFGLGKHTFSKSNKTIDSLVPIGIGNKKIEVKRYSEKDNSIKTFDPPKKDIGTGTNFHYGLAPKGLTTKGGLIPCVGGYSAGCQVIPTLEKWNKFWSEVKSSNQKEFMYSIIEEDKL